MTLRAASTASTKTQVAFKTTTTEDEVLYTVPAGKTFYAAVFSGTAGNYQLNNSGTSITLPEFYAQMVFPEGTVIQSAAASASTGVNFMGYVE